MSQAARPAPLPAILALTFLGSVSGGAFWTGTFFVTARHYGFSPGRNLALAALMGAGYAFTARRAGALVGAAGGRCSRRTLLATSLAIWAVAAVAPIAVGGEAAVWVAAIVGVAASALVWPIVESYLGAGRHGATMRSAIGAFNVTWSSAVALPLLTMPILAGHDARLTLAVSAFTNALAVLLVFRLPPAPAEHSVAQAQASVGPVYAALLRSSSWLLPTSYVLASALSPVLPYRMLEIGVPLRAGSVAAATWMVARFLTLAAMRRLQFWHGRWGTLALGAAALVGGLALVLLAPSLALLLAGLSLFGIGMGLTYYAALYYSLAVGHAEIGAGGTFEGLVGAGYTVGPLLGLGGVALGGAARGAEATVLLTWTLVVLVAWPVVRPWWAARRDR